ncbi:MAG TPA: universal stress protein, partial [Methanothrix sp.]|nr:universal stress protein [Methanothrix sp.]
DRFLLGSVAEKVVQQSAVPVLLVRGGGDGA